MKTNKLIFLTLTSLLILSCSNDSESDLINVPDDSNGNGSQTTVNYTDDISPIMQSSCVGCHGAPPTNGAPFSLVTFSQVSQRANSILSAMSKQSGTPGAMPTSGRLPQATIDLVQQWINDGKPEN
ncbi:hypothetical protein MBM09_02560 [Flaviramulus sp. BrNp1-15]|uniref:hypothetical protein n=1 Tax=Flaviramulus sp. BrNp1-15 TaxID=2916754 RepID=UPI001EE84117|nr:hypothetical protein [Flaviramulus sp. BrNp1-15]ULC59871.1 hypothetical protein MBM09_02560 [Flaviramulus sp. BrNp1-15]